MTYDGSFEQAADGERCAPDDVEVPLEETQEGEPILSARRSVWRGLPSLIVCTVIMALVVKTFIFQAFYIPSESMLDTLQVDDRVLVSKVPWITGDIDRGQVIVFDDPRAVEDRSESVLGRLWQNATEAVGVRIPQPEFVKRVIAVGGDRVAASGGVVHVNGGAIDEPYLPSGAFTSDFVELTVPQDMVWVMGDNRMDSGDSRVFGAIPVGDIVGRAFIIVWPPHRWSSL